MPTHRLTPAAAPVYGTRMHARAGALLADENDALWCVGGDHGAEPTRVPR